jgi:hypothetical protein
MRKLEKIGRACLKQELLNLSNGEHRSLSSAIICAAVAAREIAEEAGLTTIDQIQTAQITLQLGRAIRQGGGVAV